MIQIIKQQIVIQIVIKLYLLPYEYFITQECKISAITE